MGVETFLKTNLNYDCTVREIPTPDVEKHFVHKLIIDISEEFLNFGKPKKKKEKCLIEILKKCFLDGIYGRTLREISRKYT